MNQSIKTMEIAIVKEMDNALFGRIGELMSQLIDEFTLDKEIFESVISSENSYLFIAKENEIIVGILTFGTYKLLSGTKSWVEDVVIDSEYRGKGIGEKLVLAALSLADSLNIKQINLTSRPSRESANRLYRRLGFEQYDTNLYRFTIE